MSNKKSAAIKAKKKKRFILVDEKEKNLLAGGSNLGESAFGVIMLARHCRIKTLVRGADPGQCGYHQNPP